MAYDPVQILSERFSAAIATAYPDLAGAEPHISASRNPKFGDFQCNAAMNLAKQLGTPPQQPREVAKAILAKVDLADIALPLTEQSIAGPGFINITLRPDALPKLLSALDTPGLGVESVGANHTVVVDLCGVNLAKQMHVGHLRATIIGDTLARVFTRLGYNTIRQNHVGDWGLPIAMVTDRLMLLAKREMSGFKVAAIHPPEYGHWRKAMLEDIAIITGGKVISGELGGAVANAKLEDLGAARQVRISSSKTLITAGEGDEAKIAARRAQVMRQYDAAPENIERDKFLERLAKLSGGTAMILAGGATPVEQKRRTQLIEDSINATRAAIEEGIVPGGGVALLKIAPALDGLIKSLSGSAKQGAQLVQRALSHPLYCIAANCGLDGKAEVAKIAKSSNGHGLDARNGKMVDMFTAGIIDPVKVSYSAVRNAGSVAGLILTTQTLIASKPDNYDPTSGPALGGGAELL